MAPEGLTPGPEDDGAFETYEYVEEVVEYRDTRALRTVLAVVLVILLLLLVGVGYMVWTNTKIAGGAPSTAATGKMVWVRSIYGWGGASNQQLVTPNAVAIGSNGLIWTNSRNRMAIAFTPQGTLDSIAMSSPASSTAASGSIPGMTGKNTGSKSTTAGVQAVFSLDVDGNNNLYVGDDAAGNVLKFGPDGHFEKAWAIPGVVKAASNGSTVAVVRKGSIGAFNQDTGAPLFFFGSRGQGANQFDLPVGVHVDEQGFVYVADTQNQRVRKYSPNGRLVWDAGTVPERKFQTHVEAPKGIFQLPTGVTTDAAGRVVVIDAFNYNITVLDGKTGKKVATYGEYGQDDGKFDNPSGISYDKTRDYFVVADTGNNRLQVVRIPGSSGAVGPVAFVSRAFQNPAWVLCLPFIILLLAVLVTYWLSRRRKRAAEAAAAASAQQ
jgi:sugar lactone lactonase YvrE